MQEVAAIPAQGAECRPSDILCICQHADFLTAVYNCIDQRCSAADAAEVKKDISDMCVGEYTN